MPRSILIRYHPERNEAHVVPEVKPGTMNLAEARERAGLTQRRAARLAGISRQHWRMLEMGKKYNPSLATARAIARAVGVSVDDLFPDHDTSDHDTSDHDTSGHDTSGHDTQEVGP